MIIYINLIINHYLNNNAIRNTTELLRLQNNIIEILRIAAKSSSTTGQNYLFITCIIT